MDSLWYQNAIFYGVDVRRFKDSNGDGIGDLPGLIDSLDYLSDLGVDALWLLPFYETPLQDNGYDVSDYYQVDPRVGSLADFVRLVEAAKQRKMRIVVDLVLNHTSNQHPWFQAARRDPQSVFHDYYVWSKSPPPVPKHEGPIFPGEEDQVWTYDPLAQSYYFHRFYAFQPGLQAANPNVRQEILRIIDFWLSFGVSGFRLDAAPILIHEKGIESTQLEEPHQFLREIHEFVRKRLPDAVLMAEANLPLDRLGQYFGGGREMTMLMNFMFSAHVFLALARQSAEPIREFLESNLEVPKNGAWLNFLRNLDELSVERLPPQQREAVLQAFAPEPTMRIYNRGIRRRLAPLLDGDRRKLELVYSLLFSLPGSPLIMYGDEIGMGDDLSLPGRDAARTPMQWSDGENAGFSSADQLIAPVIRTGRFAYTYINVEDERKDKTSLLNCVKQMIAVRKENPAIGLQPVRTVKIPQAHSNVLIHSCIGSLGEQDAPPLLFLHNFSGQPVQVAVAWQSQSSALLKALIGTGRAYRSEETNSLRIDLPPYGYLWLR